MGGVFFEPNTTTGKRRPKHRYTTYNKQKEATTKKRVKNGKGTQPILTTTFYITTPSGLASQILSRVAGGEAAPPSTAYWKIYHWGG